MDNLTKRFHGVPAGLYTGAMGLWNSIEQMPLARRLFVIYSPKPDDGAAIQGAQTQVQEGLEITVAVLDPISSRRFFGVPMARRGIQPVWLRITNHAQTPWAAFGEY